MTRGIMLAGNDSALTRAIEAETANRVDRYAITLISNRLSAAKNSSSSSDNDENEKRLVLEWNPSSPISARTLALAAENRLERIDEAFLICSPPSLRSGAADLPLSDIEIMINDQIKGWFYLVRELAGVFTKQKSGTLILVYLDTGNSIVKEDALDVLGPAALASFKALTNSLLSSAHNETYATIGFSSSDAGNETAFASYVFKQIDEIKIKASRNLNGKLYKYGKFKLF